MAVSMDKIVRILLSSILIAKSLTVSLLRSISLITS